MTLDRMVLKLLPMCALGEFSLTIHVLLHVHFFALPLPLHHFHLTSFSFPSFSFAILMEHSLR